MLCGDLLVHVLLLYFTRSCLSLISQVAVWLVKEEMDVVVHVLLLYFARSCMVLKGRYGCCGATFGRPCHQSVIHEYTSVKQLEKDCVSLLYSLCSRMVLKGRNGCCGVTFGRPCHQSVIHKYTSVKARHHISVCNTLTYRCRQVTLICRQVT
jgi:hypothetical protein